MTSSLNVTPIQQIVTGPSYSDSRALQYEPPNDSPRRQRHKTAGTPCCSVQKSHGESSPPTPLGGCRIREAGAGCSQRSRGKHGENPGTGHGVEVLLRQKPLAHGTGTTYRQSPKDVYPPIRGKKQIPNPWRATSLGWLTREPCFSSFPQNPRHFRPGPRAWLLGRR